MNTFNWKLPVRITFIPKNFLYKCVTRPYIKAVIVVYGEQKVVTIDAESLCKLWITSITILKAPLGTEINILEENTDG